MNRFLVLLAVCLVLLIVLTVALNTPRYAEARAHEVAAEAMQTQAVVTGLAVTGLVLLAGAMALAFVLVVGLLLWAMATGRLAMAGRFDTFPQPRRPALTRNHGPYSQLPAAWPTLLEPIQPDWDAEIEWDAWENTPWHAL
jgi:hypothetical protein